MSASGGGGGGGGAGALFDETDRQFAARVQSAIGTAQAWDDDPSLLAECRAMIPFEEIRDDGGPHSEPDDRLLSPDAKFVQRLSRHFKNDLMTWVNKPACRVCQSADAVTHKETRGPQTAEEREGNASRVEVYVCGNSGCEQAETTFPRYNSPRKLLETRKGRCGEYANLFGLYCRAAGLETRYVSDWTDHVWTEVYLQETSSWMMVDSCEGVISEPSMYESGWGKKLNYVIAATTDHVVDVTPRYTRQFQAPDFQARRRAVTTSERASQEIIRRANATLMQGLAPKQKTELESRLAREEKQLSLHCNTTEWEREYGRGRVSGSLAWRIARHEVGKASGNEKKNDDAAPPESFHVETFYPPLLPSSSVSITVTPTPKSRHDGIVVCGTPCCVGNPDTLSVVVVDEKYLGCILQSRAFRSVGAFADFVDTLPTNRIVAVQGSLPGGQASGEGARKRLKQLGGFDCSFVTEGVLFVGQVRALPGWAFCGNYASTPNGYGITTHNFSSSSESVTSIFNELKLSTKRNIRPASVVGRLPDYFMPDQSSASHAQKRTAFLEFLKDEKENVMGTISGYVTKKNAPIYLLGCSAFPLERIDDKADPLTTFLLLPPPLVAEDGVGIVCSAESNIEDVPKFDIPLESSFFTSHVGSELLIKENGSEVVRTDTVVALHNVKLVGLYFSAHWCGPCRSFTPMLAEMYEVLKGTFPSHGLEIIFVSSDRDANSFDRYYASMPWGAIPFDTPDFSSYKQLLSSQYGIRGIPALVVLDAMSGQVVVSPSSSRKEVIEACNRGEEGIENMFRSWLDRLPLETRELTSMLELSCAETSAPQEDATPEEDSINPYLIRPASGTDAASSSKDEMAAKVKAKFAELVKSGMAPNTAAAKAIELAAAASDGDDGTYDKGPLDGKFASCSSSLSEEQSQQVSISDEGRSAVASTLIKYATNLAKAPWTPKFRTFKLGNKVADRIVRVRGGIDFMRSLGLEIVATDDQEYCATFPLALDLELLQTKLSKVLNGEQKE